MKSLPVATVLLALACLAAPQARAQEPEPQATVPSAPTPQPEVPTPLSTARSLLAAADYTGAEQLLRELLRQQPNSAEAHFLLAFTLLHQDKPTQALEEYAQGAKHREWSASEWIGVASAHTLLKNYPEAEKALTTATTLTPLKPLPWYLLARAQYDQGHAASAEKSLLTCLRLNPGNARAEALLGLAYEAQGHPESAAIAYRAAIAMQESASTKEAQPYLSLGMILRRQGKSAEALPLLVTAVSLVPGNPLSHQELALTKEQLGQYDEALAEMKTAVALSPRVAELHFFLGRLERRTGHPDQASAEFREAARLAAAQKDTQPLVRLTDPGGSDILGRND